MSGPVVPDRGWAAAAGRAAAYAATTSNAVLPAWSNPSSSHSVAAHEANGPGRLASPPRGESVSSVTDPKSVGRRTGQPGSDSSSCSNPSGRGNAPPAVTTSHRSTRPGSAAKFKATLISTPGPCSATCRRRARSAR